MTASKSSHQSRPQKKAPKKPTEGMRARQAAAAILKSVLAGSVFEPVGADRIPDDRERALVNRLVTTTLRRHQHLSLVLSGVLDKGVPPRSGLFEAAVRVGLTELLFLGSGADHAAVFLAVEVVRSDRRARRYARLANAVLRQAQREAAKWRDLALTDLFSPAQAAQFAGDFGPDAVEEFGRALLSGAPLDLTACDDAEQLAEQVGGLALNPASVRVMVRDKPVAALAGYAEGQFFVQDAAAALPAQLLDLPAGARVLDLCAAPGGKTAQLCLAGYDVTALDIDAGRMARVEQNLKRLGLSAELIVADALDYVPGAAFDGVLLDAPCSATGTFRRHPEVLINRTESQIAAFVGAQRKLARRAVDMLRSGGQLVFCTCSLDHREGEEQADFIATALPEMRLVPVEKTDLGGAIGAGSVKGYLRTHPALRFDLGDVDGDEGAAAAAGMDGFFAARFEKAGGD